MKLKSLSIDNFRCIEHITFDIEEVDGSHTYSLIGINESGKSSFLEAISLVDEGEVLFPLDFFEDKKPINVYLNYEIDENDLDSLKEDLLEKGFDQKIIDQIEIESLSVGVSFEPIPNIKRKVIDLIKFKKTVFSDFTAIDLKPAPKDPNQEQEDFDLQKYFESNMPDYFWKIAHHISFWKSESKYLINEPIDLEAFGQKPQDISVPLFNCFQLAGIEDIKSEMDKIRTNPADVNNLQEKLSDKVTSHIKAVWPNHPVKIKFQINNMQLSFLIEDEGVKYKAKTTSQRSDGFKQFISFLLTVSTENSTKLLNYTFLLLDEPETHLHPQAQEYLREELIKLSKNKNDNIVVFATHSNYMIDKDHLERCYRVTKLRGGKTSLEKIKGDKSSYSEVNYEVFEVPTSDYHNELYGYLEDLEPTKLEGLSKTKKWHNEKTSKEEAVSLPKYIRHSIHHPENTSNLKFTTEELVESIKTLRKLKYNYE